MRKLIVFVMTTLDGFFEGPNQTIDWHNVDAEFNEFAINQLNSVDALLFGRVTYEGMASYWPTPMAIKDDPIVAEKMNSIAKFVFSRTLDKVTWQNTRLIKENIGAEVARLKGQPGKDLIIFGSSGFSVSLIQYSLIDEFRLMVNPVILGGGTTLFKGLARPLGLKLLDTKAFNSGNVLLTYKGVYK